MDRLPEEDGAAGPVDPLGQQSSTKRVQEPSEGDTRLDRWAPTTGTGPLRLGGPSTSRRISLIGWGVGLALSLALWAVLYRLIF